MTDMLAATPLHALGMNVRNRLPEDTEEEAAGGVKPPPAASHLVH
jgi:hypothetical protein